jgi:hypothetical protein
VTLAKPTQFNDYFTPGGYIAATKSGAKGVTAGSVPFYRPGIKPKACVCPEPDWAVTEEGDDAYDNVFYANGTRMPPNRYWACELSAFLPLQNLMLTQIS